MAVIAPSILSADFMNLGKDVRRMEKVGAQILHVDVMDGNFVPNLTIGVPVVEKLSQWTELSLDVHLMIANPEQTVDLYIDAGANYLSVHFETVIHLDQFSYYLDSIHLIIKSLKFGSERPLIFFGHSLGGFLSLYYQTQSNHFKSSYLIKPNFSIAMAPMMGLPVTKLLSIMIIFINKFLHLINFSNIGFNNHLAAFSSFIGFAGKKIINKDIRSLSLYKENIVLAINKKNKLSKKKIISIKDIKNENFILFPESKGSMNQM